MGYAIFNGVSSTSLGLVIQTPPNETYPEKDVETIHVIGRNGDVILDHDSYKNGSRVYNFAVAFPDLPCVECGGKVFVRDSLSDKLTNPRYAWICNDVNSSIKVLTVSSAPSVGDTLYYYNSGAEYGIITSESNSSGTFNFYTRVFTKWMHSAKGYAILEDSYAPDVFRKAIYYNGGSYTNAYGQATAFEVEFICKPQKYLKDYATEIEIDYEDIVDTWYELDNPTDQNASPIFGPSNIIPWTNHVPYITAMYNGVLTRWLWDEEDAVSPNYAWKNKNLATDSVVYTVSQNPDPSDPQLNKIYGDPQCTDLITTITNRVDTLTLYKILVCRDKDDFDGNDHWTIDVNNDYGEAGRITVNSEYMECYDETGSSIVLKNQYVSISGTEGFPMLCPGKNYIMFDGGEGGGPINAVKLIQNYWVL